MNEDPLLTTLLDLDFVLQSQPKLIIGDGYGLYLKQIYLAANLQLQTLFSPRSLPVARTTQDIDLILRAEIVTNSDSMQRIRTALDDLNFTVVDTAKYTQFTRPKSFSYLMMKLFAFRDRFDDANKDLGQHHALDIYRIVGMLRRDEDPLVRELSKELGTHPKVVDGRDIACKYFVSKNGLGRIRIQEHPLFTNEMDLDRFGNELALLLGIS